MKAAYRIPAISKLLEGYKLFVNRETAQKLSSPAQQTLHILTGSMILQDP